MVKNISIFGITSPMIIQSWQDKFEEYYSDDESALYVSKETFHSNEDHDIKDFDFHYVIECIYLDNKWYYSLRLVVDAPFINAGVLESIADFSGIETKEVGLYDILAHGGCDVKFGCETSEGEELDEDILTAIANVFECMDSLRGFHLDHAWNMIGSNGWDILRHALYGDDLLNPAMERRNK